MKLLVLSTLLALAFARPDGGYPRHHPGPGGLVVCSGGLLPRADGTCGHPTVTRRLFVYRAPYTPVQRLPPPPIPEPQLIRNVLFVKAPEAPPHPRPVVVPPPREHTQVIVLSKNQGPIGPELIQVPAGPALDPNVYFVNYDEGTNPTLPGGISLQTALAGAAGPGGGAVGLGGGAGVGLGGGAGVGLGGGVGPGFGGAGPGFGGAGPGLGGAGPGLGGAGPGFGGAGPGFGGVGPGLGGVGVGFGDSFEFDDDDHDDGFIPSPGFGAGVGGGLVGGPGIGAPSGQYGTPL